VDPEGLVPLPVLLIGAIPIVLFLNEFKIIYETKLANCNTKGCLL